MIKFDMKVNQNFAQFKSDDFQLVFVEHWGDGVYELFAGSENHTDKIGEFRALTDLELNSKLEEAYFSYTTSARSS